MTHSTHRNQTTIEKSVELSGVGIHTGCSVTMRFLPQEEEQGIVFERRDLPGSPRVPASVAYLANTARSTELALGEARIVTVEHVLSAIYALGIDNLLISLDGPEPPITDGSAQPFVDLLVQAKIVQQEAQTEIARLPRPVYYSSGDIHLVAVPADEFRVSFTIHYPQSEFLRSQYCSFSVDSKTFSREIAPCRTYALYEEVEPLIEAGLIKGGRPDNAVVIRGDEVLCKGGLRFSDEMVRHKVLDLIGDLALVTRPFKAHVMAVRSGHRANVELAKRIDQLLRTE